MPFSYRIDADAGMLFVVGEGVVTQKERLDAMNAWLRDPSFGPGLDTLCDFSRAESTPTLAELGEIVAIIKRYAAAIGRTKLAMITSRPVVFGVGRQFQALVGDGPLDVEVFTDRDAALAWLRGDQPARSDAS